MKVNIHRDCEAAKVPTYAHATDAGFDLYATSVERDEDGCYVYHTGVHMQIPEGYVGLVFCRSSICKVPLYLTNGVGVIDSGYRGEITFKFFPRLIVIEPYRVWCKIKRLFSRSDKPYDPQERLEITWFHTNKFYKVGEKIGQMIILPYPKIEFNEVDALEDGERGNKGYGSSGK